MQRLRGGDGVASLSTTPLSAIPNNSDSLERNIAHNPPNLKYSPRQRERLRHWSFSSASRRGFCVVNGALLLFLLCLFGTDGFTFSHFTRGAASPSRFLTDPSRIWTPSQTLTEQYIFRALRRRFGKRGGESNSGGDDSSNSRNRWFQNQSPHRKPPQSNTEIGGDFQSQTGWLHNKNSRKRRNPQEGVSPLFEPDQPSRSRRSNTPRKSSWDSDQPLSRQVWSGQYERRQRKGNRYGQGERTNIWDTGDASSRKTGSGKEKPPPSLRRRSNSTDHQGLSPSRLTPNNQLSSQGKPSSIPIRGPGAPINDTEFLHELTHSRGKRKKAPPKKPVSNTPPSIENGRTKRAAKAHQQQFSVTSESKPPPEKPKPVITPPSQELQPPSKPEYQTVPPDDPPSDTTSSYSQPPPPQNSQPDSIPPPKAPEPVATKPSPPPPPKAEKPSTPEPEAQPIVTPPPSPPESQAVSTPPQQPPLLARTALSATSSSEPPHDSKPTTAKSTETPKTGWLHNTVPKKKSKVHWPPAKKSQAELKAQAQPQFQLPPPPPPPPVESKPSEAPYEPAKRAEVSQTSYEPAKSAEPSQPPYEPAKSAEPSQPPYQPAKSAEVSQTPYEPAKSAEPTQTSYEPAKRAELSQPPRNPSKTAELLQRAAELTRTAELLQREEEAIKAEPRTGWLHNTKPKAKEPDSKHVYGPPAALQQPPPPQPNSQPETQPQQPPVAAQASNSSFYQEPLQAQPQPVTFQGPNGTFYQQPPGPPPPQQQPVATQGSNNTFYQPPPQQPQPVASQGSNSSFYQQPTQPQPEPVFSQGSSNTVHQQAPQPQQPQQPQPVLSEGSTSTFQRESTPADSNTAGDRWHSMDPNGAQSTPKPAEGTPSTSSTATVAAVAQAATTTTTETPTTPTTTATMVTPEEERTRNARRHRIISPPTFHPCDGRRVMVTEHAITVPLRRTITDPDLPSSTLDVFFTIAEVVDKEDDYAFFQSPAMVAPPLATSEEEAMVMRANSYVRRAALQNMEEGLVYLQGGPGFGAPRPISGLGLGGKSSWAAEALSNGFQRVVLMDQRGTGRSTPITKQTLQRRFPDLFILDGIDEATPLHWPVTATQANIASVLLDSPDVEDGIVRRFAIALSHAVEYMSNFRADNIVLDAQEVKEALLMPRSALSADKQQEPRPWGASLGQSFGGFCTMAYLSNIAHPPRICLFTGGIAPMLTNVNELYSKMWNRVKERNLQYYERYPGDVDVVKRIVRALRKSPPLLPSGGVLTPRRFLQLGMSLGSSPSSFASLHNLFATALLPQGDDKDIEVFSRTFLKSMDSVQPFDDYPIYFLMHESIYADAASTGSTPTNWAAHNALKNFPSSDFDHESTCEDPDPKKPILFYGEMVFPWMAEGDFAEVSGFGMKALAHGLATKQDWTPLYNAQNMRSALSLRKTKAAAAVYYDDMYVDFDACMKVAKRGGPLEGCKVWITNDYQHSGLRDNGAAIFLKLLQMAKGSINTPS